MKWDLDVDMMILGEEEDEYGGDDDVNATKLSCFSEFESAIWGKLRL